MFHVDTGEGVCHDDYMTKNNRNRFAEWTNVQTGEVFVEKYRNSFGGFVNMVRRVEARYGLAPMALSASKDGGTFTAKNGMTFTQQEVWG